MSDKPKTKTELIRYLEQNPLLELHHPGGVPAIPKPERRLRWFRQAKKTRLILIDSVGLEWDACFTPDKDCLRFFDDRFELHLGGPPLPYYYLDSPTRKFGYVLWSEPAGAFLGEFMGLGFWSKLERAGQDTAVTWPTPDEALQSEAARSAPGRVIAVEVGPDGPNNRASIRACVAAGMEAWDPYFVPVRPETKASHPKPQEAPEIVIEVSGGNVTCVYGQGVAVTLVDWDNVDAGDRPGLYPLTPMSDMPESTKLQVKLRRQAVRNPGFRTHQGT